MTANMAVTMRKMKTVYKTGFSEPRIPFIICRISLFFLEHSTDSRITTASIISFFSTAQDTSNRTQFAPF